MCDEYCRPLPIPLLMRVIAGIVADEYARETKRSLPVGEVVAWDAATQLDEDGVGLDSLTLLKAAQRVADFFAMRDVGYEDYLLVSRTLGEWADLVAQSLAVKGETVTFRTSGSTGEPKSCTHPFAHMVEEAVALARLAGSPQRIVSCVAPHHIYGFLHTIVSAAALSLETVDLRAAPPGARLGRFRSGDLVVATPHLWSLMAEAGGRFAEGVTAMTSTAPMSAELADRLAEMGLTRLVEIYGSSETSGIGWRADLRAPYELLPWWTRVGDRIARAGVEAVALPDVVEWRDARRLRPVRREDGAVQIAGVNVYPVRVAETIRRFPGVTDCIVRRSGRGDDSRLEAFVVSASGAFNKDAMARGIEGYCQRNLTAPERPARIEIGRGLPLDAMGKPTAW
jgi:4-coumarate--CoA ligase (photoactive yellow protein activation family)